MNFKSRLSSPIVGHFLAVIAGALLTLSFAPFSIYPLAVLSLAMLLALWLPLSPSATFFRGWLFGIGFFAGSVSWIYISIHTYSEAPLWLAIGVTAAFVAILALFPAATGFVFNRYFPSNTDTKLIFAFPALWIFFEWVRSWIFTGFPWVLVGYSQINSPLKGYAPILSVYGLSLAVALTSGLLVNAIIKIRFKKFFSLTISLAAVLILWAVGAILSHISWTEPAGKPIQVSLVQGNIPQQLKWSPEQVKPTLMRYETLSQPYWKNSKIIIWPEAAIPLDWISATEFLLKMDKIAKQNQSTLITGIPIKLPNRDAYLNSVIVLGNGRGIYNKHRLVPFGEYTPLPNVLGWIMDRMNIPMSNFIPGEEIPAPLKIGDIDIATFICYEIAYPEQVTLRNDHAGIILTVSNDAWFGNSIAQPQHLEIGRMRALESGRPVLFVSNDGITAIILPNGDIKTKAPAHETYVITDTVQPMKGKTPWQRATLDRILILLIVMLAIAWRNRQRNF